MITINPVILGFLLTQYSINFEFHGIQGLILRTDEVFLLYPPDDYTKSFIYHNCQLTSVCYDQAKVSALFQLKSNLWPKPTLSAETKPRCFSILCKTLYILYYLTFDEGKGNWSFKFSSSFIQNFLFRVCLISILITGRAMSSLLLTSFFFCFI